MSRFLQFDNVAFSYPGMAQMIGPNQASSIIH